MTNNTMTTPADSMLQLVEAKGEIAPLALRPREAAKALGVSERTLWTLTHGQNPPPHFRVGNAVLYPVNELRSWLTQQSQKGVNNE